VDAFDDCDKALETFATDPTAYGIAIIDYTMRGMTGLDLAREIHLLNSGLPVVLATGLLQEFKIDQSGPANVVEILRKPFRMDELPAVIHRLIQGAAK